jgi:hypothetical protein
MGGKYNKERAKEYRAKNASKIKEYRELHREEARKYYEDHIDKYRERDKKYRLNNKLKISKQLKQKAVDKRSKGLCKKSGCYRYIVPGYTVCVSHLVSDREYRMRKRGRYKKLKHSAKEVDAYIMNYKTQNPCEDCGEVDPIVLCFHHLRDKKFNLGSAPKDRIKLPEVIEEIKKCIVLCQNCHARRHSKRNLDSDNYEKISAYNYNKTKGAKQLILLDYP